jgi:predicted acylesterase/phospholipase RssA
VSNALTTTNVFATTYYGDGGFLSNISSSAITQPFANLVVSNALTTTNVFAATEILTGTTGQTTLNVTGNIYASNAMTTANVNITDTLNVTGSLTANAANATFFFDTFTIPYINTQDLAVSSAMTFTGPLATFSNLYVPGNANIEELSVSNLSVTGNLYVTATNLQTTNALTINNSGTMTAFKVTQNETSIHTHNVAEFWDATTLAMVIDPEGNVAIHTVSSPGYALTVTDPVNFETLYIRGKTDSTSLYVTGNVSVSNALTTTNVFATRYYGDGGLLSNISSSAITQPFANLVASNALTTTNVFANTLTISNTVFIGNTFWTGANSTNSVVGPATRLVFDNTTTPYAANKILLHSNTASANICGFGVTGLYNTAPISLAYYTSGEHSFRVDANQNSGGAEVFAIRTTGQIDMAGTKQAKLHVGVYGTPASNTTARIDGSNVALVTSGSGLVGFGTITPTANLHVVGNIYASNALTTTNIFAAGFTSNVSNTSFFYSTLTVPFVYSTTLNVASTANVLTASVQGSTGQTSLNVTGNMYVSNALTTTNVYLLPSVTNSTAGQIVKGALEFNGTSNVFYGTSSTIRGLIPVQYFYQLNADTAFGTTASATPVPAFPGMVNGVQLQNGKYCVKIIHILTITTSATAGNTQLNMLQNGGSAVASVSAGGLFSQNITTTTSIGATATTTQYNTIYITGTTIERISAITTAVSTATTYYTTIEGTFAITTPGGWYPVAQMTSPGTFTATAGVRRGSFIYLQKIGDNAADVNIGGWS